MRRRHGRRCEGEGPMVGVVAGSRSGRLAGLAGMLALLVVAGCGKTKEEQPATGAQGQGAAPAAGADGGLAVTPPKPEVLQPIIQPLGPEGTLPVRVVFEFARPVVTQEALNEDLDADTRYTLSPEVAGVMRFTGP